MNTTPHHYFASSAFGWAVAATRAEAVVAVAREAGSETIARHRKNHGGLYVWSCRVDAPIDTAYQIDEYHPVGVPTAAHLSVRVQTRSGTCTLLEG